MTRPCLLLLYLVLLSCRREPGKQVILIQPFGDLPDGFSKAVYSGILDMHPHVILQKPIPLPVHCYYKARNRYRADSLLSFLGGLYGPDTTVIGLTSKDISTTNGKIADWGVMGLGYRPGNACVVSTFRLTKKNLAEQLCKVSVHELGHTAGLPHCEEKTCFMRGEEIPPMRKRGSAPGAKLTLTARDGG